MTTNEPASVPTSVTNEHSAAHRWSPAGRSAPASSAELDQLPPFEAFLRTLDLQDTGARTHDSLFTGSSQWMLRDRVFGGQVAAQAVVAATRTVPENRLIHSMHGYFFRPGDVRLPITYAVNRSHDGNSFSARTVTGYQRGHEIWSMTASFQERQPGFEHTIPMPQGMPDPDELASEAPLIDSAGEALANYWVRRRPFRLRHVNGPVYLDPADDRTAAQAVWVKAIEPMPDASQQLHRAALAYVGDFSILEPLLRAHGLSWVTPGLRVANLDYAIWWHHDVKVDDWMLFVQDSPTAQHGRGLVEGRIFSRDGVLVASVAQEGMVRVKSRVPGFMR